ncbi:MAG: Ger(x)C family spore germination protein [Firmicutes bacterium]|nr:Ger(x)C family spore germination protein [Bacillota bacterium]
MRFLKMSLLLILSLFLTGCWDALELEEQAYVVAVGMDLGEGDNYYITYQIGNPQVGSSDRANAEREPASEIITVLAPDKISARELANVSVSRRVTFSHAKTFIISEELAKSEKFLEVFEAVTRDPQIKRQMDIIISKERAEDFIRNNNPVLETRPHKNYELMDERWKASGLVPASTINRFLQREEEDAVGFLAIYATIGKTDTKANGMEDKYKAGEVDKTGGNTLQMIGAAVIKEGRMIGTINGEENRLTLLLRPHTEATSWYATYPDPYKKEKHLTARILRQGKPKIKVDVSQSKPIITVEAPVKMQILLMRSFIDYVDDQEKQKFLTKAIEGYLNEASMVLVKKAQNELKVDIFQWSLSARKEFLTIPEFEDYNWIDKFPQADVRVNFKVQITNFGKQLKPININKIKE